MMGVDDAGAVRTIFLIRHGEKPTEEPQREGVDQYGRQNEHSLILTAPPSGTTLVCWEHTQIIEIAQALPVSTGKVPPRWPSERFDMVFSFSRGSTSGPFALQQIPQLLLAGDSAVLFPT